MKLFYYNALSKDCYKEYLPLTLVIGLFSVTILQLLFHFFLGFKGVFLIFLISFSLFILFNFRLVYYSLLILMFLPYVYPLHQSTVFALALFASVLVNYKFNIKEDLNNPLLKTLLLFIFMTLPSFVNTPQPLLSLMDMSNLVAMVFVFCATLVGLKSKESMMKIFHFFIVMVVLHSFYVIFSGLTTGKRVFGILGVYYIDFAGLASVLTLILFIYVKGINKIFVGAAFLIVTFGLILTQTRNAWLSCSVAVISLIVFLVFKAERYKMNRSLAVIFLIGILVASTVSYFAAASISSNVEDRLNISTQTTVINPNEPTEIGGNSFVSRAFIWHTAVMAFNEHPVIGIGVYSFRYVSNLYYEIPKAFYKLYVLNRTPHVTYLQVLTETGILGFIFFMVFIIALIKFIAKTLRLPKTKDEVVLTLLISWSFVYIIFSMLMTESWLYGQYAVWIGVLLGFLVNNNKLLSHNSN